MTYTVKQLAALAGYDEQMVWNLLQAGVIPASCDSRTLEALRIHSLRGKPIRFEPVPKFPTRRGED